MGHRFTAYFLLPFVVAVFSGVAFADETFFRLLRAENFADAVRHADDNVPPANRDARLWAGVGLAHENLNAPERALACYLVGINMDGANHDALLGAARVYNRLNQSENALNMAKRAMEAQMSGEASWEFARACIALGRTAEAKTALEKVVESDANNVVANRELGRIYYNDKDFAKALPLLKRALARQADSELALMIAVAHREGGQMDSAIAYFNRASDRPEVVLELARLHYGRNDFRNAAASFEKAQRNLLTGEDFFGWGRSLEEIRGDSAAILNAYTAAVQGFGAATTPNALIAREKVGRAQLTRRDFRAAEAALAPLHRADPNGQTVKDIHILLARANEGLGNISAAITLLERAIQVDDRNVGAYAMLADLYTKARPPQPQRAQQTLTRLQTLDPNNPGIHLALGEFHAGANKHREALESFTRSFTLGGTKEAALGMMNAAWNLKRFDVARDAAESVMHMDPALKEPQYMLVRIHMAEKNYSAARTVLLPILRSEADNLELWKNLAECCEKLNDPSCLNDADKRIIALDPRDIPSRVRVAQAAAAANDFRTAYGINQQLASLQPQNADVQKSLYEIAIKQQNNSAAITHLRAFLALRPNDATGHRDLGQLQFAANDFTGALASFQSAVRADRNIAGMYQNYAAILMRNNAPATELMPVLEAAVRNNEANEAIFTAVGNELMKQNNFVRAAEMYRSALAINGRNLENLSAFATALERAGNISEAILAYEQVTALNQNATREFKSLGDLYVKQNQMPQAVAAYKRFLAKVPNDVAVARIVGDHEFGQRNWEEANKFYAMVTGAEAQKPDFIRNYATSCFEAKNFNRAGMLFKQLSDANPRDPEPLKKMYEIEIINKNPRGSAEILRKYVALVPNDAVMQRALGDLLFEARDAAGALTAYKAVLRLDPAATGLHKRHVELLLASNAPAAEQIAALNAAIAANEADAAMFARLGELYRAANNCRLALPALERAAQMDAKNTAVLSAIADCHVKGNNIAGAVTVLEQVTLLNPQSTAEFKTLGDLYVRQNNVPSAVNAYKKFLERGANDTAARLVGEAAFRAENWSEAVRYLGMVRGPLSQAVPFREMLGRAAFNNNDNQRALEIYRQLSQGAPQNAEYVKMLYDLAVKMGARDDQATNLRRFVQLNPRNAEMQITLGNLLHERRDTAGALAAYRAAIVADKNAKGFYANFVGLVNARGTPVEKIAAMEGAIAAGEANTAMLVTLGNLYVEQRQPARAVPLLEQATKDDARNVQLLVALAQAQVAANQIDQAIITYERFLAMENRAINEIKQLGDLYARQNKAPEAMRTYKRYLERNPNDNAVAFIVAKNAFEAKEWTEAVKYFAMVRGDDAKKPEALKMYGTAAFEAKDNPRALTVLRELVALTPRDADVLQMLEEVARRTGSHDMAVDFLKQYVALRPQDAAAQRRLGDALFERQDSTGALAAYRAVLRTDPQAKGFHGRLVSVVMRTGTDADKMTALNAAIAAGEGNVNMFAALGELHKKRSEWARAATMFEEALKLKPNDPTFLGELADCQLRAGNLDAAAKNLQMAIELNPQAITEHKTLGDLFTRQKNTEQAMRSYVRFLERSQTPDPAVAQIVGDHAFTNNQFGPAFRFLSMVTGNNTPQHLYRLGKSALEVDSVRVAIDALERFRVATRTARPPNPHRDDALRSLITAYEKAGDGARAANMIDEFLKGPPVVRDADLAFRRANLVQTTNPDAAARIFEENTRTYPRDHRNFLRAGIHFSGRAPNTNQPRNATRAVQMLEGCTKLVDTISRAWFELGFLYGQLRRDKDMMNAFQKFIALESRNADAILRVGEYLLLGKNVPGEAMMFLEMANSLNPNNPRTLSLLARGYMRVGNTEEGVRILERVTRARGATISLDMRVALAEGYTALGRSNDAAIAWKQVVDNDENKVIAHRLRYAQSLMAINRHSEALGTVNEILAREPQNLEAMMLQGRVRAAQRNFEDALEIYRRVAMINPNYAPAVYERANVLLLQQNFDGAKELYNRVLQLDPKYALAELGLARVARAQRNQAEYDSRLQRAVALDPSNKEIQEELRRSSGGN